MTQSKHPRGLLLFIYVCIFNMFIPILHSAHPHPLHSSSPSCRQLIPILWCTSTVAISAWCPHRFSVHKARFYCTYNVCMWIWLSRLLSWTWSFSIYTIPDHFVRTVSNRISFSIGQSGECTIDVVRNIGSTNPATQTVHIVLKAVLYKFILSYSWFTM